MLDIEKLKFDDKIVCIEEFVLKKGKYCPKCNYELEAPLIVRKGTVVELSDTKYQRDSNDGWYILGMFDQFEEHYGFNVYYTEYFVQSELRHFKKQLLEKGVRNG